MVALFLINVAFSSCPLGRQISHVMQGSFDTKTRKIEIPDEMSGQVGTSGHTCGNKQQAIEGNQSLTLHESPGFHLLHV